MDKNGSAALYWYTEALESGELPDAKAGTLEKYIRALEADGYFPWPAGEE